MIVGPASERPAILALALGDRQVVDAGDAQAHQPVGVGLPVLVAVAAEPVAAVIVPLVGEPHRDAVLAEGPQLLDQPVVALWIRFARQKFRACLAAVDDLGAVAGAAGRRVGERVARGLARVPAVLGEAPLLGRGLQRERRQRRAGCGIHLILLSGLRAS